MNKFYAVREPGKGTFVIESAERPRTLSYGGTLDMCSKPYDTLEALKADYGLDENCRECGHLVSTNYIEPTKARLIKERLCFTCDHYTLLMYRSSHRSHVVIDHIVYWIEKDTPLFNRSFAGFGGSRFDIEFLDGRTITTHNLWRNGEVPEHFRERMPDNARFVQAQKTEGISA